MARRYYFALLKTVKNGSCYQKVVPKAVAATKLKFCQRHDILKEFLEIHASEVLNMLITEWNWDDAKEVWQEEAREEKTMTIARKLLMEGSTYEFIQKITGLDMATIESLQNGA